MLTVLTVNSDFSVHSSEFLKEGGGTKRSGVDSVRLDCCVHSGTVLFGFESMYLIIGTDVRNY